MRKQQKVSQTLEFFNILSNVNFVNFNIFSHIFHRQMSTPKFQYPLTLVRPDCYSSHFHHQLDNGKARPTAPEFNFSRALSPRITHNDDHETNFDGKSGKFSFFLAPPKKILPHPGSAD